MPLFVPIAVLVCLVLLAMIEMPILWYAFWALFLVVTTTGGIVLWALLFGSLAGVKAKMMPSEKPKASPKTAAAAPAPAVVPAGPIDPRPPPADPDAWKKLRDEVNARSGGSKSQPAPAKGRRR